MSSRTNQKSKTATVGSITVPSSGQTSSQLSSSSAQTSGQISSQVTHSTMTQSQPNHLQHQSSGPSASNTNASGPSHNNNKPYFKKGNASGYNGKKYYGNTYGSGGQNNYGGHMHSGGSGNYHGQSNHIKTQNRDRHSNANNNNYDGFNANSGYIKNPSNSISNGNSNSYDAFTKNKELGSTGSLTGSNSSNTTSLSKSNNGTVGSSGPKGNHSSSNWTHSNNWKHSRRNNYGNYTGYDSNRHKNSLNYDSVGNSSTTSSGNLSGNSSTPATNDSPTSKFSTPEEFDQNRSSPPNSPPTAVEPVVEEVNTPAVENPNVQVLPATTTQPQLTESIETPLGLSTTNSSKPEELGEELEKLTISTSAEETTVATTAPETDVQTEETTEAVASQSSATTPSASSGSKLPTETAATKLSPNVAQFNSLSRPPKHNYASSGYGGYQSNYYNKSGGSHSYHTYVRGNGGKKNLNNQSGYVNPNMHPAALAAMKNPGAVSYLPNIAGRSMHSKQPQHQQFHGMPMPNQHSAMHPLTAMATPMGAPGTHIPGAHPNAYIDNNVAAAGMFPSYGIPPHMVPFYSIPHSGQHNVHQQAAQSLMHPHQYAVNGHGMPQQQMMSTNAVHSASNIHAQSNVTATSNASGQSNPSAQANSPSSANQVANGPQPVHSPSHSIGQHSSGDSMQNSNCGDCCAPAQVTSGYYGPGPLLNYPHGMPINYPFAPASLVPIQPYPFAGAKVPQHFFSHPIGTPINYMDMNYMPFMQPNTYPNMIPNPAESHHQSSGQALLPTAIQSPPPNATTNSVGMSVNNDYNELSRPGSSYETQMMDAGYSVPINQIAYDPHKHQYALLGYMSQAGAAPMHQMPSTGADYSTMVAWQQEQAANHAASAHTNPSSINVTTTGNGSTQNNAEQASGTSQPFSTDSIVMCNYAVGSACDTNNPTTSTEIADK